MSKQLQLRLDEVTTFERVTNGWVCYWQTTARKGVSFITDLQLGILVMDGTAEVDNR